MNTDVHELAGAYALDALTDEERRFFERHLDSCGDCQGEVDEFQATATLLGTVAAEEPPPAMRDHVLAAIASTPQEAPERAAWGGPAPTPAPLPTQAPPPGQAPLPGPASQPSPGPRERLRQLLPAVAAVIVLGVAGVTVVVTQTAPTADEQLAALVAAPDARLVDMDAPAGATARLVWSAERGEGIFLTEGLEDAPGGHAYALWVIEAETPVLLGMFQPEHGHAAHAITDQPDGVTVAVTVEVEEGVEAPTSDPVIVGQL